MASPGDDALPLPSGRTGRDAEAVLRACAEAAREILLESFGTAVVSDVKGRGNVVTEVDFRVEQALKERILDEFPDHAILGEEESATARSDGWMWVIDPIDGTKNFSRGIPHFSSTIALCHNGEPQAGFTLQPMTNELFFARKGHGTTLNGRPARASEVTTIRESVVGVDLGYDNDRGKRQLGLAYDLWPGLESIRINGSAALGFSYVACGRWDLYLHANLQPWDSAAGLLQVREAGAVVTDRDGAPATLWSEAIVAAPRAVHEEFFARFGRRPWREEGADA